MLCLTGRKMPSPWLRIAHARVFHATLAMLPRRDIRVGERDVVWSERSCPDVVPAYRRALDEKADRYKS